ncbi:hypothetical protein ACHAWF_011117 [Thalassiosira exigua]
MEFRAANKSSFHFETDIPPSSRNIHPSGILHAFRSTPSATSIHGREEHAFAWMEDSIHLEQVLEHLETRGFDVSRNAVFVPYSTQRNWIDRYPHAVPALECGEDGNLVVHINNRPYPNGLGRLASPSSAAGAGGFVRGANAGPQSVWGEGACLADAERDELHVEIYDYVSWLKDRIEARGSGKQKEDGGFGGGLDGDALRDVLKALETAFSIAPDAAAAADANMKEEEDEGGAEMEVKRRLRPRSKSSGRPPLLEGALSGALGQLAANSRGELDPNKAAVGPRHRRMQKNTLHLRAGPNSMKYDPSVPAVPSKRKRDPLDGTINLTKVMGGDKYDPSIPAEDTMRAEWHAKGIDDEAGGDREEVDFNDPEVQRLKQQYYVGLSEMHEEKRSKFPQFRPRAVTKEEYDATAMLNSFTVRPLTTHYFVLSHVFRYDYILDLLRNWKPGLTRSRQDRLYVHKYVHVRGPSTGALRLRYADNSAGPKIATIEDLFDIIHKCHLDIGHRLTSRDHYTRIKSEWYGVTEDDINVYVKRCPTCMYDPETNESGRKGRRRVDPATPAVPAEEIHGTEETIGDAKVPLYQADSEVQIQYDEEVQELRQKFIIGIEAMHAEKRLARPQYKSVAPSRAKYNEILVSIGEPRLHWRHCVLTTCCDIALAGCQDLLQTWKRSKKRTGVERGYSYRYVHVPGPRNTALRLRNEDGTGGAKVATLEGMFDIIHEAHSWQGHKPNKRDHYNRIKLEWYGITEDEIDVYLSLCPYCRQRGRRKDAGVARG